MNSQRIREVFGSYAVEVLAQSDRQRIASLCSVHDGHPICRTLAVTEFVLPLPSGLVEADAQIRTGASIGETLTNLGLGTEKHDDQWCTLAAGSHFARLTGGEVATGTPLAVRQYTLSVRLKEGWSDYAVIAEAYHPDHIPCMDSLQAPPLTDPQTAIGMLQRVLQSPVSA